MLRILFIDDDPDSVADAIEVLDEKTDGLKHWTKNFEDGKDSFRSLRPDLVVLDIWKGEPQTSGAAGCGVFDMIWDQQFCPVIVYSADPKIIEEITRYDHPLVKIVTKGSGSDEKVFQAVASFQSHIEAFKEGAETIRDAFSRAMRDVAPDVFTNFEDEDRRKDTIVRAGRRRVAALMDEPLQDETSLVSWEQYLCPPISRCLQLGDILRVSDGQCDDPTSHRVVLTPSCDLVSSGSRSPKVKDVLVATCDSMKEGLKRIGLEGVSQEGLSKHLILSQGFLQRYRFRSPG